uniref:Uncharacterized protein n=1 Tax=Ditylenchus dipsaci TaxID=166011 RepID=A0A915DNC6_9BILA
MLTNQLETVKQALKADLKKTARRFSLTCDVWSDKGLNSAYLVLSASALVTIQLIHEVLDVFVELGEWGISYFTSTNTNNFFGMPIHSYGIPTLLS